MFPLGTSSSRAQVRATITLQHVSKAWENKPFLCRWFRERQCKVILDIHLVQFVQPFLSTTSGYRIGCSYHLQPSLASHICLSGSNSLWSLFLTSTALFLNMSPLLEAPFHLSAEALMKTLLSSFLRIHFSPFPACLSHPLYAFQVETKFTNLFSLQAVWP